MTHPAGGVARWRGHGFGLTVEAAAPVPGLTDAAGGTATRTATWVQDTEAREEEAWQREARSLVDYRFLDGRPMMLVEHHPDGRYRVSAPGFGRHLVSPRGDQICSALPTGPGRRWQRLFFAQVLPLAATLQGLDLFHASAVAHAGRAVAFSAPSGTGKTSIAAHLVADGFEFVTDDVLALEISDGTVTAHPGPGFLGVAEVEVRKLSREGRRRLGPRIGRGDKAYFGVTPVAAPVPLAAVCFLARTGAHQLEVVEEAEAGPRELLGSSFLPHVRPPERLLNHLDVCAHIAASVRIVRVGVPDGDARAAAAALAPHVRRLAEGVR
jgi:hypothetical protein